MTGDERYEPIQLLWSAGTAAPMTQKRAAVVARAMLKAFGSLKDFPGAQARGFKRVPPRRDWPRRCWASTGPGTIHNGLPRLVHDVSHWIYAFRHPNARPHEDGHNALERGMAAWAVAKGYHHPSGPKPKAKPTVDDKLARIDAALKRWDSKYRRAGNAMRVLRARRKRVLRYTQNRVYWKSLHSGARRQ